MTVNISLSSGSIDGGLRSADSGSYTNALAGSVITGGSGGTEGGWGWWLTGGVWNAYQTFLSFSYTPPTDERIVSADLRLGCTDTSGLSVNRNLRAFEYDFGSSVGSGDWRNTAWFAANGNIVDITNAQNCTSTQFMRGGSAELIDRLYDSSPLRLVVTSSDVSGANAPSGKEWGAVALGASSGTYRDPALIWTTIPEGTHEHVGGAQVRLSDGGWACLESDGAETPTITLEYRGTDDSSSTIATIPTGTSSTDFRVAVGAYQTLALVVDDDDNLYVLGPRGNSLGATMLVKAYEKGAGLTWTAKTARSYSTLAYDRGGVQGVAATWHNAGTGGTIVCVTARGSGNWNAYPSNDIMYALLNCNYLLTGSGSLLRNSGSGVTTWVDTAVTAVNYSRPANELGTGIDVQASLDAPLRGYFFGWSGTAYPGSGSTTFAARRYILSSDGTSVSIASASSYQSWAAKEADSKSRVLAISDVLFAVVTMDPDTGYGPSFNVLQNVGSSSTFTQFAYITLGSEGIASLPSPTTMAGTAAWDAVYDPTDNKIWLYYINTGDARSLMRTSIDMDTYLPTTEEVEVTDALGTGATSVATSIRVERNARFGDDNVLVSVAIDTSGVLTTDYYVDSFNLAPTAPTLTPKANFDADDDADFEWTFNDPNVSDTQSAYELDINTSAGVDELDTDWVSSSASLYTLSASTIANEGAYQWRVRTKDETGTPGPWSEYLTFQTSASGTVTITSPDTDNPDDAITSDYIIEWSVAGTTQVDYRVIVTRVDDSSTLLDTGWVASEDTSYTVSGMLSDIQYEVSVAVRNGASVESGAGTRLITPSYSAPEAPTVTVIADDDGGYILVVAENPATGTVELGTSADGFEDGVTGYDTTNCSFEQTSAYAAEGDYAALLTVTSASIAATVYVDATGLIEITGGDRYTVSCQAYAAASADNVAEAITWYDATSAELSSTSAATSLPASVWTECSYTASAPTSAAYAAPGIVVASPSAEQAVYIDELLFSVASDRPTPIGNEVHRRRADGTGSTIVIADEDDVGLDGSWYDYTAATRVAYEYRIRAIATTGSADSEWSGSETLTLQGVWLHDPLDAVGTARQYPYGKSSRSEAIDVPVQELQFAGRTYPVVEYGESQDDTWTVKIQIPHGLTWSDQVEALRDFAATRRTLVFRDNRGRAAYCSLTGYRGVDVDEGTEATINLRRVDWTDEEV